MTTSPNGLKVDILVAGRQGASTPASLSLEQSKDDVRAVDVKKLRAVLAQSGMELDPAKHQAYAP